MNTCDECHKPFSDCRCRPSLRRPSMDLNEAKAACEEYHRLGRYTISAGDALEWAIAEIDELRGKLAEYESQCYALRAVTAEKNSDILRKRVKDRDEIIGRLLEMLRTQVLCLPEGWSAANGIAVGNWEAKIMSRFRALLHARALEIAGRKE